MVANNNFVSGVFIFIYFHYVKTLNKPECNSLFGFGQRICWIVREFACQQSFRLYKRTCHAYVERWNNTYYPTLEWRFMWICLNMGPFWCNMPLPAPSWNTALRILLCYVYSHQYEIILLFQLTVGRRKILGCQLFLSNHATFILVDSVAFRSIEISSLIFYFVNNIL